MAAFAPPVLPFDLPLPDRHVRESVEPRAARPVPRVSPAADVPRQACAEPGLVRGGGTAMRTATTPHVAW